MDDRQKQIVEGAGLQESRLNTDFIDWLNKWGSTILMVLLVAALAWWGWRFLQTRQLQQIDEAFVALEAAVEAGSPDNLILVAKEHEGRGSVYEIASLAAADIYLDSARRGVTPGGDPMNANDLITDEQREDFLEQAGSLYDTVLDRVRGKEDKALIELSARGGVTAVAITRGQFDEARGLLEELESFARTNGLEEMASYHAQRQERLDDLKNLPPLYPQDQILAALELTPTETPDPATDEALREALEGASGPPVTTPPGTDDESGPVPPAEQDESDAAGPTPPGR
ncbi:MAG: hypothetical protein VYC34_10300 [Planctomycetota bacterium]|nr:hypothetical protein [Planctomycetota bacterium]